MGITKVAFFYKKIPRFLLNVYKRDIKQKFSSGQFFFFKCSRFDCTIKLDQSLLPRKLLYEDVL